MNTLSEIKYLFLYNDTLLMWYIINLGVGKLTCKICPPVLVAQILEKVVQGLCKKRERERGEERTEKNFPLTL